MSDTYNTAEELASYGMGRQIGEQLKAQPFPGMHAQALLDGLADVLEGTQSPYKEDQIRTAMNEIQERMNRMQKQQSNAMATAGEQFLKQNAARDEVTVTSSGLQYEVLSEGSGKKPAGSDTVRVHYHGTLIDGTVFDSSVQRGEPLEFPLNAVISGWTEGLQLMAEGAKYRLFIPHELGYGARGAGGTIAPYSTLIFDVELLAVL
jgi:FKBP-type peptidyl-prolyl cis-trans isomerase FklB